MRRARIVKAVSEVADLEFVNGGGTGSIETTAREEAVTEVAAGSGFYHPALFDRYSNFTGRPAALFALPVVRRLAPGVVTVLGGGYPASGAGPEGSPSPTCPRGCATTATRAAARSRHPCTAAPPTSSRSATGCGSATRRRANCANASAPCTWWRATA